MTDDFRSWPDLARRDLGGAIIWTNDELFASADNLINPESAVHDRQSFGPRGKIYDGWETRRRRPGLEDSAGLTNTGQEAAADEVIVRLAAPALVRGVVIDTAFFTGNYPTFASVEGTMFLDHPTVADVRAANWVPLIGRSELEGDTPNTFVVFSHEQLISHVRLRIYPDGGVARFRVHGEVLADPRFLGGRVDLAATLHGGRITGCSNMFYSSPSNVLAPGVSRVMSDGWETSRRRTDGNDWLTVSLGAAARLHHVVVDTSRFVGNAPGWVSLSDVETGSELLPRTRLQPDTVHRFRIWAANPVSHVRLDAYPDGGLSRLRVLGEITEEGQAELGRRWLSLLPEDVAKTVTETDLFD